MKVTNKTYKLSFMALVTAMAITSCRDEYFENGSKADIPADGLAFTAFVNEKHTELATRDLTQDPLPVTNRAYYGNFYIEIQAEIEGEQEDSIGTYVVPSGFQGQLEVKDKAAGAKPLNWYDAESMHSFWSWTIPWLDEKPLPENPGGDDNGDGDDDGDENNTGNGDVDNSGDNGSGQTRAGNDDIMNSYTPSTESFTLKLRNTTLADYGKEGSWNNGEDMERFIGAKAGPYSYKENGRDVPLQYRHLMSKIVIEDVVLNTAQGVPVAGLQGDVMFINMPTEFTFYPHPTQNGTPTGDDRYMEANGRPIVVTNQNSAHPDSILSFAMINDPDTTVFDQFYICPEIDFSKVEFKVALRSSDDYGYEDRGEYWGNFVNMPFIREPGTDYDDKEGGDDMVLHAGEVAYFSLILQEFGGGGSAIYVRQWAEGRTTYNKHYPNPGIYSDADARNLSGTSPLTDRQAWENQYDAYGDGRTSDDPDDPYYDQDLGIFNLYSDVTMGTDVYYFNIGKGYILNGNGYTINLQVPRSNPNWEYILIGNMRDVYINFGDYSIYIDNSGYIYFYNEDTGDYEESELKIPGDKTRYNLNLKNRTLTTNTN